TVGLRLASDVGGCDLPEDVCGLTEDRQTVILARTVRERLFTPTVGGDNTFQRSLFHLKIRERFRDKIRFGLYTAIVPSDKDRLLVGFPPALTILYYLLRPLRL